MTPEQLSALKAAIKHDSACKSESGLWLISEVECDCNLDARAREAARIVLEAAATLADLRGAEFGTEVARCAASIIAEAIMRAVKRAHPRLTRRSGDEQDH